MIPWLIGVLGNLAGDTITGIALYLTRHLWMPYWTAFTHKHKELHLSKLTGEPRTTESAGPGKH